MRRPPDPGRRGPAGAALVALLVTALLTGCAGIPGEGPVITADKVVGNRAPTPASDALAHAPHPGSSPGDLVRDFIFAAASFHNDHEISRQYLDPAFRFRWKADSSAVVYDNQGDVHPVVHRGGGTTALPSPAATARTVSAATASPLAAAGSTSTAGPATPTTPSAPTPPAGTDSEPPPSPGETAVVTVTLPVVATVDARGVYSIPGPGDASTVTRSFGLVGTADGWRISTTDDGILIDAIDFGSHFRRVPLYFVDSTGSYLVPDLRWFPVAGASGDTTALGAGSTPSAIVAALLLGPPAWLQNGGVLTGVPSETRLTVNAVKVVDGVASVDLTAQAHAADPQQWQWLHRQLEQTLVDAVPEIATVRVTVEQQSFDPSSPSSAQTDVPRVATPTPGPAVPVEGDPRLLVALDAKGEVVRWDGRTATVVPGLAAMASPTNTSPAVDHAGTSFAVLTANRTRLVHAVPPTAPQTLVTGQNLLAPSLDPFGWTWTALNSSGDDVVAAMPGAPVARVRASWLSRWRLRSLRVSSEGARAVIVAQEPDGSTHALVCGIVRDAKGVPTQLGPPHDLLPDALDVVTAGWVDAGRAVVLARRTGRAQMPWIVEIGGEVTSTLAVDGVSVAVPAKDPAIDLTNDLAIYVTQADGSVKSRNGLSWTPLTAIRWPSTPG